MQLGAEIRACLDDGGSCGGREPVLRPAQVNELNVETGGAIAENRGDRGQAIADIDGRGHCGLAGPDALAVMLVGGRGIVVMPRFLHRPRRLLRARVCRVHRQPGKAGRSEEQHEGCEPGTKTAEGHKVNLVTWRGGEKDSTGLQGLRVTGPLCNLATLQPCNFVTFEADRAGFEPARGLRPPHAFQACALSHSATRPNAETI